MLKFLKVFPKRIRINCYGALEKRGHIVKYEIYHTKTRVKLIDYLFNSQSSATLCAKELENKYDFSFATYDDFKLDLYYSGKDVLKMCREIKNICRTYDRL